MSSLRALARLFAGTRRVIALSLALALVQALLLVPIGLAVRTIFDDVIPDDDRRRLVLLATGILLVYFASAAAGFLTRYVALVATKREITALRGRLLAHLYGLRQEWFDRAEIGRVQATVVQDTERLDIMLNAFAAQLLPSMVVGGALAATLAYLDWRLFALLAVLMPLLVFTSRPLGRAVRRWTHRYQRSFDDFSTQTGFALRAMYLTKAHAAATDELARREAQFAELGEVSRRMAWLAHAYTLANGAVAAFASVAVMTVGGLQVASGTSTIGDLLAFFAVLTLLRARISSAFVALPQVIAGLESNRRLEELLAADAPEPYRGNRRVAFSGSVRLDAVRFRYGARTVLRHASLEIEPHERVALAGPNGAGKSTVVSLILGLYRPDDGRLLADGRPYDELELDDVRRAIGVVLQDPLIFHGTVRENIAFGVPGATDVGVEEAAEWATAAEFVRRLPAGYETDVGAEGVRLSAGQRQRIAIARALLARPALVILDEPATYLDAGSTASLVENLSGLAWRPAILLVGHDELLLPAVDRVYRLEAGVTTAAVPVGA